MKDHKVGDYVQTYVMGNDGRVRMSGNGLILGELHYSTEEFPVVLVGNRRDHGMPISSALTKLLTRGDPPRLKEAKTARLRYQSLYPGVLK